MAAFRKQSGRAPGWAHAIVFNALMILLPILAARIVIAAFSVQGFGATPTPEALSETRRSIDSAFTTLSPRSADHRSYWADLFDRELRARDMSAARGFLLAAPLMLDGDDSRALRAAADADISGTEDQRVASAALLFLPDDVRARYERSTRPPSMATPAVVSPDEAVVPSKANGDPDPIEDQRQVSASAEPTLRTARLASNSRFSVLGDFSDLADRSRRWINGERVDAFVLRLTGLGMVATSTREEPIDIELAASILKSAHRAGRLQPSYARYLDQRLNAVISENDLGPQLAAVFEDVSPRSVQATKVRDAFIATLRPDALPRLEEDLALITRIADLTSPNGAITMLEHVRSSEDLRRARLIAEAGGDRAPALAKQMDAKVLTLAQTGVVWNRSIVFQIMGLAAIGMALLWAAISALGKAFIRSRPPEILVI